jgi:pseudouridine-5'-phosphate glycosidase
MGGSRREDSQRRLAILAEQMPHLSYTSHHSNDMVVCSEEVECALREGRPVVALESTIVAHGMPYPQNLQTALEVEAVVRQHNATPATIAILGGVPRVGLTHQELEYIARRGGAIRKVSRRDVAHVCALQMDGATTVSATMLLAMRAGISVFVTGGIGGVHRGGEETMDVSADLTELGRTPILVVCAGAKSILDIPRTLEYLETQGVCVSAYGTDEFPAFFTRESGCKVPCRFDTPEQVAAAIRAIQRLQMGSGMVLGVPIPAEHAAVGVQVQQAISRALKEGDDLGIRGNQVTPFLLKRVTELTGGKSLESNIHLVKNNAKIGASIACAMCAMCAMCAT